VDNGKLPFFEELDAIFKDRAKNMDRMMLLEAEAGSRPRKKGKLGKPPSSDEDSDGDNDEDNDSEDEHIKNLKWGSESQLKSFGQIACRKFWRNFSSNSSGQRSTGMMQWREGSMSGTCGNRNGEMPWKNLSRSGSPENKGGVSVKNKDRPERKPVHRKGMSSLLHC
jgi:hypothetical protein